MAGMTRMPSGVTQSCRPEYAIRNASAPEDPLPVGLDVPAQVSLRGAGHASRQGRLFDLARPGNEHHLPVEVAPYLRRETAGCDGHGVRKYE